MMKHYKILTLLALLCCLNLGCKKDEEAKSKNLILLTETIWTSQTLEANGVDASGPGEFLEDFVGDAIFDEDGSGTLGSLTGSWRFASNETQIIITAEQLAIPVTMNIVELSETRIELTTSVPNPANPLTLVDIRMVYVPK